MLRVPPEEKLKRQRLWHFKKWYVFSSLLFMVCVLSVNYALQCACVWERKKESFSGWKCWLAMADKVIKAESLTTRVRGGNSMDTETGLIFSLRLTRWILLSLFHTHLRLSLRLCLRSSHCYFSFWSRELNYEPDIFFFFFLPEKNIYFPQRKDFGFPYSQFPNVDTFTAGSVVPAAPAQCTAK